MKFGKVTSSAVGERFDIALGETLNDVPAIVPSREMRLEDERGRERVVVVDDAEDVRNRDVRVGLENPLHPSFRVTGR